MRYFGVIGSPIHHSLSPLIHNFLFSYLGISAHYDKFDIPSPSLLASTLQSLSGANITLPYKEEVFGLCDEVRGFAQEVEAINTVLCRNQKLYGFNTDGLGFWECIKNLELKTALVLGAGGSARAIAMMLKKQGVDTMIYNRTPSKVDFFRSRGIGVLETLEVKEVDLLVHTTSVGLDGKSLPYQQEKLQSLVSKAKYVFDVIYPSQKGIVGIDQFRDFFLSRPKTAFLGLSNQGMDGLEMLLYQAFFAFEIFCDGQYCFEELKALFYNSLK